MRIRSALYKQCIKTSLSFQILSTWCSVHISLKHRIIFKGMDCCRFINQALDSHAQPATTGSHKNSKQIRMLSVHSSNYGMPLLLKLQFPQIWDSYDYGKVKWSIYLSFLTQLFYVL